MPGRTAQGRTVLGANVLGRAVLARVVLAGVVLAGVVLGAVVAGADPGSGSGGSALPGGGGALPGGDGALPGGSGALSGGGSGDSPGGGGGASPGGGRATDGDGDDDGATVPADAAPRWVWPTASREVVRPWEAPADDYSAGHRGIDVLAAFGTRAVAVADGTVSFAGPVAGRTVVSIDHGDGLVSTLDSVTPEVATGDDVRQGSVVGRVSAGHCRADAPCVHLGARLHDRYVDPTPFLPAAAWPVLLPEDAWTG